MNAGRRSVPTLPVPILRDAVARETAGLSLRKAAREIAVSPNGLRNFLKGSVPHPATRAKLERWLSARGRGHRPPSIGLLIRLVGELAIDLSPGQAAQLGRDIAELLARAYEARRLGPPRWVLDLVRHHRPPRGRKSESVVA
jgi:transcriptional regulator with XRE-family HTH domain